MERALVVLETDGQGRELLREAGELAAGVDAHLDVLTLMTAEEFAEKSEALEAAAAEEHTSWDDRAVLDNLRQNGREVAESTFEGLDLDWDVLAGRVGDSESEADRILEAAEEDNVDHVFLTGKKRSPTGKAVFGDRAQSIILNFEGPVTSLLE